MTFSIGKYSFWIEWGWIQVIKEYGIVDGHMQYDEVFQIGRGEPDDE